MHLDIFRSLWGDHRSWDVALPTGPDSDFDGIESRIPSTMAQAEMRAQLLHDRNIPWIGIAITGGDVIPHQAATPEDHLVDLSNAIDRARIMPVRFISVLGGNDRWPATVQADFIARAQDICIRAGMTCCFETHRSRILATPWITLDVIRLRPDALFTADISHWVVCCERLLNDPLDDFSPFVERVHHIQARVGQPQAPQVTHPAAPEHASALHFHQEMWEQIWVSQRARGYATTTLTPEFGPDGYLPSLPFTDAPVADLAQLNRWMAHTEREHFIRLHTTSL
ncbi:sugar phosphate isomerase/epimerase [Acetobacter estunensis]|uniref:sugar phosphate isomerase/epimerase family protein n=1 Tax=Acetobacter estunensis TaxID=104097 RepID=UPI001C2DBBC9|nr:sugar phosphate isomerase/epimerase [Acetobacter estunensis]MBV1836817.1 sugar phosphate isomerase/epimerase [Acetobacter estunensis]